MLALYRHRGSNKCIMGCVGFSIFFLDIAEHRSESFDFCWIDSEFSFIYCDSSLNYKSESTLNWWICPSE